jgi:hypothetical protein
VRFTDTWPKLLLARSAASLKLEGTSDIETALNDTEALEVFVTLAGTPPLRPRMRVDVYFYGADDAATDKP